METLDGIQHGEHRVSAKGELARQPQDGGFRLNELSRKSSIMERRTPRLPKGQEGNR